jgi:hypothetical protein
MHELRWATIRYWFYAAFSPPCRAGEQPSVVCEDQPSLSRSGTPPPVGTSRCRRSRAGPAAGGTTNSGAAASRMIAPELFLHNRPATRRHMHMMSVEDARSTIRQSLQPLPARRAHLAENVGTTLAESLCISTALPPADVSAMDGYAVRDDGPWILRLEFQVAAPSLEAPLRQGEAIRIGTGTRVPTGSTAGIRDEYVLTTTIFGRTGVAHRPDEPIRDDTRRRGEFRPSGAELAPSGRRASRTSL